MLKRLLSCKKGEGYIEMCIGVIAFVMVLVIAINIFSFITLKVEIDQIAEDLIEVAPIQVSLVTIFGTLALKRRTSMVITNLSAVRMNILITIINTHNLENVCGLL